MGERLFQVGVQGPSCRQCFQADAFPKQLLCLSLCSLSRPWPVNLPINLPFPLLPQSAWACQSDLRVLHVYSIIPLSPPPPPPHPAPARASGLLMRPC